MTWKGGLMTEITLRYEDYPDKCISYLEFVALKKFAFDGKASRAYEAVDGIYTKSLSWTETYANTAKPTHKEINKRINEGSIADMEAFYDAVNAALKPKKRGNALKDAKKRTSQAAFQKEQLGDAFIDNNALISAAKKSAFQLSEANATPEEVAFKANELTIEHNDGEPLTNSQMDTLCDLMRRQIDKYQKPDHIESRLIDADDKNLWFMWGKIKRRYIMGETFAMSVKEAAEFAHISKRDVKKVMTKLVNIGALKAIQPGKAGKNSGRAAIYRREI